MNSFMMVPAETEESVATQLQQKAPTLYSYVNAEINLIAAALHGLPRTSTLAVPKLYSGEVDISQLSKSQLCAHYQELPANKGPKGTKLQMQFFLARVGFMAPGKTITVKGIVPFTDSSADAMKYSNGILLTVEPPVEALIWKKAAYITPLSNNLDKTEYLFYPDTRFTVKEWKDHNKEVHGRRVVEIVMQVL